MKRPRIKSVFPPFPLGDGRIRIGGADFGLASEITDDANGNIWHLLGLLDGTRDRAGLLTAMRLHSDTVTAADIDAVLATLTEMGFLEDAAAPPPPGLPPVERERYQRNLEFFSYFHRPPLTPGDFQTRLRNARVTVLGLGGMGSFVALSLAAVGVGNLLLVDFDKVELVNLNRQLLYTDADIGSAKAEAAAIRLAAVNPHVRLDSRNLMISGVAEARSIMAGSDLLICAADRPRLLLYDWLNTAALAERVAWVRGGNDGLMVSLCMHVPYETACFRCVEDEAAAAYPEYAAVTEYVMGALGDRTINPCNAPMAGMIGNLVALEAVKYLTGMAEPVTLGAKLVVDVLHMETQIAAGNRLPDCSACSVDVGADAAGVRR